MLKKIVILTVVLLMLGCNLVECPPCPEIPTCPTCPQNTNCNPVPCTPSPCEPIDCTSIPCNPAPCIDTDTERLLSTSEIDLLIEITKSRIKNNLNVLNINESLTITSRSLMPDFKTNFPTPGI